MSVVEGLPFAEDKKDYILSTLDPMLEEMVSHLEKISFVLVKTQGMSRSLLR